MGERAVRVVLPSRVLPATTRPLKTGKSFEVVLPSQPGDGRVMQVRSHDLDGGHLVWLLERLDPRGAWAKIDTWNAVVENGKAERRWKVPKEAIADPSRLGRLLDARFGDVQPERVA